MYFIEKLNHALILKHPLSVSKMAFPIKYSKMYYTTLFQRQIIYATELTKSLNTLSTMILNLQRVLSVLFCFCR